jgi:hypothetical protein
MLYALELWWIWFDISRPFSRQIKILMSPNTRQETETRARDWHRSRSRVYFTLLLCFLLFLILLLLYLRYSLSVSLLIYSIFSWEAKHLVLGFSDVDTYIMIFILSLLLCFDCADYYCYFYLIVDELVE